MFTINVEKECGCFKKSDYQNNMTFDNKDDAQIEAKLMVSYMNQKFCQKHMFYIEEVGNTFIIKVDDKPKYTTTRCCNSGNCS